MKPQRGVLDTQARGYVERDFLVPALATRDAKVECYIGADGLLQTRAYDFKHVGFKRTHQVLERETFHVQRDDQLIAPRGLPPALHAHQSVAVADASIANGDLTQVGRLGFRRLGSLGFSRLGSGCPVFWGVPRQD